MKRTEVDFSRHILTVIEGDLVNVYDFSIPNTRMNSILFIVGQGVTTVTGDYGNWVFCREFHPSKGEGVSGQYWDEKLQTYSVQKSHKFSSEETVKQIEIFERDFEEMYGREMNEEELEWVEQLTDNVFDEFSYINTAYRENPSSIDYESVPFGEARHVWLNIIYDGFDEMCNRLKK